ncbi:MAG: ion channel [Pseudomonadota bacterium]
MLWQFALGALLIAASVAAHVVFIGAAIHFFSRTGAWFRSPPAAIKTPAGLAAAALWMMAAHGVAIWFWAIAFMAIGGLEDLDTAVYFAAVCFTTLGFGDIIPDESWRHLTGLCAANGLLAFGVSTAFLVELLQNIWREERDAV